jgi:hypothetical protein
LTNFSVHWQHVKEGELGILGSLRRVPIQALSWLEWDEKELILRSLGSSLPGRPGLASVTWDRSTVTRKYGYTQTRHHFVCTNLKNIVIGFDAARLYGNYVPGVCFGSRAICEQKGGSR